MPNYNLATGGGVNQPNKPGVSNTGFTIAPGGYKETAAEKAAKTTVSWGESSSDGTSLRIWGQGDTPTTVSRQKTEGGQFIVARPDKA